MKLVTFSISAPHGPMDRLGALMAEGRIIDLNAAHAWHLKQKGKASASQDAATVVPSNMLKFLEGGRRSMDAAREAVSAVGAVSEKHSDVRPQGEALFYLKKDVRLRAPIPNPGALRDFIAFEEHAKQGAARRGDSLAKEWYEIPIYYKGNHREIYGPDDEIPWPSYTRRFDFEVEIACIVGQKGRDISPEEAPKYIAGYTILNDFSARDIQKKEMAVRLGPAKGKDFATALGPYLLTADEMAEPEGLSLKARINGEVWCEGKSGDRYWSFATMLSHVSQEETVYPGDILGSGTFYRGCGLDLDRWVQPGDEIELEVDKLGTLKNIVGKPKEFRPLEYRGNSLLNRAGTKTPHGI